MKYTVIVVIKEMTMNNLDLTNIDMADYDRHLWITQTWNSRGNYYYRKTDFGFEIYFDIHQHECDKLNDEQIK